MIGEEMGGAPAYRSIDREELQATIARDRTFIGLLFAAPLALDDLDLAESRFERCLFRLPAVRSADFSGATFRDCRFERTRFASCKFGDARLHGCDLFDVAHRQGCSFAFCEMPAVEAEKCNFATGTFERCDLHNLRAVECSFRGARFPRSSFTKVLSRRSSLTRASFDKCNLSFADLSGLVLQNCEFLSCRLSEASLIDTDLGHSTMLACALDRIDWDRARLAKADLRGSHLAGLDLALLADYAGLMISESEQSEILKQLGVEVR
jgi:fluoroquinolone resistance protein